MTTTEAAGPFDRILRNAGWHNGELVYLATSGDKTYLAKGASVNELEGEHLSQFGPGVLTWSPDRQTFLAFTLHQGAVRWYRNAMLQPDKYASLPMVVPDQTDSSAVFVARDGCVQLIRNGPGTAHELGWDMIRKVTVSGGHVFVSGLLNGQDTFTRDNVILAKELVTDFAVDSGGDHWIANVTRADAEGPIQRILHDDDIVGELADPGGPGRVFHASSGNVWAYILSRWDSQVLAHATLGDIEIPDGPISYALSPDGTGEVLAHHDPKKNAWTVLVNRESIGDFHGIANQGVIAGPESAYLAVVSKDGKLHGMTKEGIGPAMDEWVPHAVFLPDGVASYVGKVGEEWWVIRGKEFKRILADQVFARETLRVEGARVHVSVLRGKEYLDLSWE
ncbi:MAG: hypothetical protein IPK97_01435 [Ahniella sp.]|nr:hypothetical protein [Ahniella sp.]